MKVLNPTQSDEGARLDYARDWLATQAPELSAKTGLSRRQKVFGLSVLVVLLTSGALFPIDTTIAVIAALTACYVAILIDRVAKTVGSLQQPDLVSVTDEEASAVPHGELPVYTVLVPLYREASVVAQLVNSLGALDYPRDRLDIKLIVEGDDSETLAALAEQHIDDFDVVVVPAGAPRTKPKALNYGLTFARGELVTIFDAEDRPDPLQLRKAAVAFGRLPETVGCLQAKLDYWNSRQNLITRLFGIEYLQWFRLLLPGLAGGGSPVPLGGTSNHIRRLTLESLGTWDAFNVTEDADLGIRMHRAGLRCAILDSTTWEEANSDFVNWNNQRSRWYKGYLQTWLVHMRHPVLLARQIGWRGFLEFNAFVGGTPLFSLINVAFWALTVAWFSVHPALIKELFPAVVYYPALFCFVIGNMTMAYLYVIAARISKQPSLVWTALLVPLYWLMMGLAAVKALWQLAVSRSLWEKTIHGLTGPSRPEKSIGAAVPEELAAVPTFVVPPSPELALQISSGYEVAKDGRRRPRSVPARVSQRLAVGLLVFVVYILVAGGIVTSPPSAAETLNPPLPSRLPNGAVIGTITAPRVGLRATIVQGDGAQVSAGVVGHVPGSSLPGGTGDSVIAGHRVAFGGVFGCLDRFRPGDGLVVHIAGGTARYRVMAVSTESGDRLRLNPSSSAELTMVTSGKAFFGASMLVVRSQLVSATGVRLSRADPADVRSVVLPQLNGGWLALAGIWLIVAVAVAVLMAHLRRRWGLVYALLVGGPVVVVTFAQACLAGGHALSATL